jgi:hypothetical protein
MGSLPTSHNGAWSNKGLRGLCVMPVWGGGGGKGFGPMNILVILPGSL